MTRSRKSIAHYARSDLNTWIERQRGIHEYRTRDLTISIHSHIDDRSSMFVTCYQAGIDRLRIGNADDDIAALKRLAFERVRERLSNLLGQIPT